MLLLFFILAVLISGPICLRLASAGMMGVLRALLVLLLVFAALLLLYAVLLYLLTLFLPKRPASARTQPIFRFLLLETIAMALWFCRVSIKKEGLEQLPKGTFMLAGNHRSAFDPMIALTVLRSRELRFVSKPANFDIPVLGKLMWACGFLPINRENDRAALATIMTVSEKMKTGASSFGIYPEGTRSRTGELLPFRNGCFKAAQRAGVPLVVVTVDRTDDIKRNIPFRKTQVAFRVCGVIGVEELKTHNTFEIGDRVRDLMLESLNRA